MGYSNRRRCPGFSFIEIVMAMTILAMLVGISVVTYSEGVQESKRDTALQQLHYISNAIQRWEMVKNSRYSYESLRPLEGEFLKNVEADPWGREYVISLEKGIVYSLGSDGTDTDGSGLSVSFDTDRDVAPAAPAKFTVHRAGNDMNFAWEKPVLNIDGSPIGTDLDHYLLYYRTSAQSTWTVTFPGGQTIGAADESKTFLWSDVVTEGDTVYFNLSAVDTHNNTGPPSQPAGIFVVQETKPVINMFSASPSRCPLGTPFNVRIDVSDGDANLKKITLSGGGVINEVWENATLPNVFHPVISFSKTFTTTTAPFDLKVEAYDGISTVSKTLDTQISFTNAAPRINTLSPGSYNITVDPNAQMSETSNMVEVTYLIEASDGEANLTQLTLEAAYDTDGNPGAEETLSKTWTYGPSGVSLAVESYPWSVLPKTDQTIEVKVTAKDKVGAVSTVKRGTLRFSTDGTPPQHLTYWIDKSNPTMENEDFLRWWIRDRTVDEPLIPNANYFEGDCWSWENESPPVTYHMAISTSSPVNMVDFLANAITVSTTNASSKWVEKSSAGAAKYTLTPGDGLKSGFIFDQTATYYSVLEARNSVGLWSKTSATPLHHSTKNSQNAFGYDSIKPVISEIKIDSLGPVAGTSDVWFDGTLNVSWTTEDYVIPGDMASGVGSGPYSWQYYIIRETTPGYDQNLYVPDTAGTYVTVKSPEFRAMQVESAHPYETARYILNIRARDVAGNWSDFYSAGARLDMTEPTTTVSGPMPVIENAQGGLILASNTILASWFDVFHDPESGIESYDWGVATTNVLGGAIPDIVPWQRVEGFLTNGSYVQNDPPLLTNDIEVYACLRARNYAGRVSQVAFSERAVVDISLETRLSAFPRVGHESMDVVFKSSVEVGGIPDFEYTFLFDGTYANPARRCVISTDLFSITTSYTYSLADYSAGRHSARVSVRDNNGTGTLSIQDIYFELYPSPYVLAVFNASSAVSDLMRFYRSESMSTGYVWEWDCNSRTGIAPIGIEMGPNDRYAIIPFNNTDPLVAPGYTRLTMIGEHGFESNHQGLNFASFAPYLVSDCAVSPDGSNIILGGNGLSFGTGTGWLARILVNPSSGKVYGNPDSDWGSYSVVDGKSIKVNALALWDGGISGAVAAQSSNLGYPNMTNGVAPLELGLIGELSADWVTFFGTTNVGNAFKGISKMTVSPDNNWLAMTTIDGLSDEIYVSETKELSIGTGSRFTTSIPGLLTFTNPEWMPDSSRFIVACRTTGDLYSCSITGFPTPLTLQPITTTLSGPVTNNPLTAVHIDLTDDGKQILLCGTGGGNKIWRGEFTSANNVQWKNWAVSTLAPVAARFVKPYDYGAPRIKAANADVAGYSHPRWSPEFTGSNLWTTTAVKVSSAGFEMDWRIINTMNGTGPSTPDNASANFDVLTFEFDSLNDVHGAAVPYKFEFRNSVGTSYLTTSFILNRP